MQFRLLGPLEVTADDGSVVDIGPTKDQTLLAVLLLHGNETVSTTRLVDELWGDAPPPSAVKLVQTYVSHLRRTLGDSVETRPPGYALRVDPTSVDIDRFAALVRCADDEPPSAAASTLREALALWRGDAAQGLVFEAFAAQEVEQLEDSRLDAVARRIDADLALGRHEDVVSELRALLARHPHRERFAEQLMLALYRSSRQGDALAVYRDTRRRLADDLGLEPGDGLRALEADILRQAPSLAAPATLRPRRPRRSSRRMIVAAAVAGVALAVLVVGVLTIVRSEWASRSSPAHPVARHGRRVAAVSPGPKPAPGDENPVVEEPLAGMRAAAAQLGIRTRVYWNGVAPEAAAWAGLVVVGATPDTDRIAAIVRAYPHTHFLIPESVTRSDSPFRGPRNVTGLAFDDRELGYLSGALAALMARPGSAVSAIGGLAVPEVQQLIAGYVAGARAVHPRIRVLTSYAGTFDDQQPCESIANRQIDGGASVVFDVAGACGYGAMQAAGIRGVWGIGIDSDLSYLGPQILASAVKRMDRATELAVTLFARGELPDRHNLRLNLANDALGLVGINNAVPARVRARLETIAERLRARDEQPHG